MGRNIVNALKPPMAMVLLQLIFAAINVMYKLAANEGMNLKIIIAYRFMFATVVMLPFAVVFERYVHAHYSLIFIYLFSSNLMHIKSWTIILFFHIGQVLQGSI